MNINFTSLGTNHGILSVQLEELDLKPAIQEKLKTIRKTAHLKGFRQGAVPESMIQKLYGQAVKDELIQKLLNDQIQKYQEDQKRRFIGDLLQGSNNFEEDLKNNLYQFEVGLSPDMDLSNGLSQSVIPNYQVNITDELVTEELNQMMERYGPQESVEASIVQEKDLITLEVVELLNGIPKEGGISSVFEVLVDENCHPALAEKIKGQGNDFTFEHSIFEVEVDLDEPAIRKYLLKLQADDIREFGPLFQMKLIEIKRKKRAELNEDFFKSLYGPDAEYNSEEDFRIRVKADIQNYYQKECEKIQEIKLTKELFKNLNLDYPDAFLKKWLRSEFKEWAEKNDSTFDHDLYHFKEGLTWQMIREAVMMEQNIQLTEAEVYQSWINDFRAQYPSFNLPMEQWMSMAERGLKDKEKFRTAYMNLVDQRCFEWLKNQVTKEDKKISIEEFRDIVKQINSHDDHFHGDDGHDHHHG